MLKKLIFQINIPPSNHVESNTPKAFSYISEMYKISELYARRYAKKFGAEFYLVTKIDDFEPAKNKHLDYQKLKAYDFKEYDRIIYFDSDYIIKDNAPNLFEICGNNFSAVPDQGPSIVEVAKNINISADRYFNAGFMYFTKDVLNKTRDILLSHYIKKDFPKEGQGLLNKMLYDQGIDFLKLNHKDWNPVKLTFGKYADHYVATKKKKWGQVIYPI
jgi:lipopolysaccharide biosynthesis glycosyltransferase